MKTLIRSSDRRELRATAGRAGRTVAHMFDSVISWFTPQRRARIAFPLDITLGALLAFAAFLNAQWWGGFVSTTLNIAVPLALGVGVAVHRVRPGLALTSIAFCVPGTLLAIAGYWAFNGWAIIAAAIVIFGATAYGGRVSRWIALAISGFAAMGLFASTGEWLGYNNYLSSALSAGLWLVTATVIALLPWLLGELVRSIRNRRTLSAQVATVSTQVATVSTQRDAALTRADLEAERTRVARDVHDIVAHSLTVVIAQADGARYATAGDSPAAADAFETIAHTARDALADVRVLLTELRHTQEAGPQPGLPDLDALLAAMRDSGLALEVREFGDRGRLTESRELALYRIVQESLTNALRHGDGTAALELEWGEQAVDLVVTNAARNAADAADTADSTGQPAAAPTTDAALERGATEVPADRGHGIDGMRERASLAGGELSVHDGAVFRVRARLPLEPPAVDPNAMPADTNFKADADAELSGAST